MGQYLNAILSLTQKLPVLQAEIDDKFIEVIMLNGLGDEYVPMIITMESWGRKISCDYVNSILIQENTEQRTKEDVARDKV